ncbi:MAG: PaaX family transcriptional regulator C-terminal domain-containing protein [Mycobacteriales bacterium]|nr:PaaX family transcriptional regulator C-terminal domain-containing protein [Mycobacteriales bacterium]
MDARSALFDLYGDHLRTRGGQAPVAALVRLLAPLGIHAPAVRTAISRMVRQGWLTAVRLDSGPGYALTPRAVRRLDEAGERIYRTRRAQWDGQWHLLVVHPPAGRADRERLQAQLSFLGYGSIGPQTWVSPRPAPELDHALSDAGARADRFTSVHDGDSQQLIARAWDLDGLARSYALFLDESGDLLGADPESLVAHPEEAFAARSRLVHAWRKFLFVDPGLPAALLPADWPGAKAAAWFDEQSARLLPAARTFLDACLDPEE